MSDQLRIIGEAYAEKVADSDRRLDEIARVEGTGTVEVHPPVIEGRGTAYPPTIVVREQTAREQLRFMAGSITTLIDVLRVGQGEAERTAKGIRTLTLWLVCFTVALLILTGVLVWDALTHS